MFAVKGGIGSVDIQPVTLSAFWDLSDYTLPRAFISLLHNIYL